jgi:hypothetical protein
MKTTLLIAVLFLAGCSSTSSIVVGKSRPEINPSQLKIYLSAPKKYEEVAVLDTSSKSSWAVTDQGKMDVVVTRLKEGAAKLGANGVLLKSSGDRGVGSVSTATGSATAYGGSAYGSATGISAGIFVKAGSGLAIYVEEE